MERVPDWVKNNANWWSLGVIEDHEFVNGLEFLIKEKILIIGSTASTSESSGEIPEWIKNNAGWWANGQISEGDFLRGIQFLVENGILKV